MKAARIILLLLVWHSGFSQWNDNFEDGDFVSNPSWTGNTADFKIENYVLKLSAPAVGGAAYLSTPSENINDATWQFSVMLDFNPSSSNYTKIYLVSNSDIFNDDLKGYFIKIGGSSDEVSLFRQDGPAEEEIIDGMDGRLSLAEVKVQVLVNRTSEGLWQLSSKLDGENDWYAEGGAEDISYVQSSYFGIQCVYTATRSTKFYFDDFIVTGMPYIDLSPPLIDTVYSSGTNNVVVEFSEPIKVSSANTTSNYVLNNLMQPNSIVSSIYSVELEFDSALEVINNLSISSVEDLSQNIISDTVVQFIYIEPLPVQKGDIIINEIMADPSPREELPEIEYVELHNVSSKAINMTEWSFRDKTSSANITNIIILPDSFLILCKKVDVSLLQSYGNIIGSSSWPSLNNSGDSLSLVNGQGELIDAVVYNKDWYKNEVKQDGGWSLERINPNHPCSGHLNWQASTNSKGGTPGKKNSIIFEQDDIPPTILNFSVASDGLTVIFDEPISENLGSITITPANAVVQLQVNYNQLHILTSLSFKSEEVNEVKLSSVADCFNNVTNSLSISFIPDFDAPEVDTVFSVYPKTIEVYFNENVQAPNIENFQIEILGSPSSLEHDLLDQTHVTLYYDNGLNYAELYMITCNHVADAYNNMTVQSQYLFTYRPLDYPQFTELLITEIMADPEPRVKLPEYEYIELTNRTSKRLLIKDLILADAKDNATIPSGIIEPYERLILTKTSAKESFGAYAKTFGIPNWPALNNTGDQIMILDTGFQVIHHVSYKNNWYDDEEKKAGGWSLEMIDETNYCSGNTVWSASTNSLGGTPGAVNSVKSSLPDLSSPHITEAFAPTSDIIVMRFNESLTNQLPTISISTLSIHDYNFTNFSRNELWLNVEALQPRIKYEFNVAKILDCVGNINDEEKVTVILPEVAKQGEVVVSEILFNPRNEGVDFIELYNNSAKYISLLNWQISNGTSSVTIPAVRVMAPYSFRVFTSQPETIINEYPNAIGENIYSLAIPALPNEDGKVVLHNGQYQLYDSINYQEDWHFPFLSSVDGISLERIDFDYSANLSSNWASAAATENYATPGYLNSQSATGTESDVLSISPKVIVPDANGSDDFTNIKLSQSGSMVSIIIYNLQGQPIKQIANNTLIGNISTFTWDGTDDNGAVVALGHYIVVANIISTGGATQTFREKVVVGTGF
jgi:hypothetical protein